MFVSLNFQKNVLAKDIMTRDVVSVSTTDSLVVAYQKLINNGFSGLPVCEQGLVVGLITRHDVLVKGGGINTPGLISRLLEQRLTGASGLHIQLGDILSNVGKIMNPEPILLDEETPLENVFETFSAHGEANPIPIVNSDGALVGIISRSDMLKFVGDMLQAPLRVGDTGPLAGVPEKSTEPVIPESVRVRVPKKRTQPREEML